MKLNKRLFGVVGLIPGIFLMFLAAPMWALAKVIDAGTDYPDPLRKWNTFEKFGYIGVLALLFLLQIAWWFVITAWLESNTSFTWS